jgi:AraC-like DNA-binding protein
MGPLVVNLEDVMGSAAGELLDRVNATPSWQARFHELDRMLQRRAHLLPEADSALTHAWSAILRHRGNIAVTDIARTVGWSRRQLSERFAGEYGITVKEAARIARFHHSRLLIQRRPGITLADAAAAAGYYDQAHMAREWRQLAGCPPSIWLGTEELPFVQDSDVADAPH